jgi:hypothetical protein
MRIATITGTYLLLLVGAIALHQLLPALDRYAQDISLPVGTVAGVSIGGVIEPTPTNTLYEQLEKQKALLNKQEQDIAAKQDYLQNQIKYRTAWINISIVVLFLLTLLNFYLDHRRGRLQSSARTPSPA